MKRLSRNAWEEMCDKCDIYKDITLASTPDKGYMRLTNDATGRHYYVVHIFKPEVDPDRETYLLSTKEVALKKLQGVFKE